MSNREVTGSLFERNGRYTAVLNLYDKNGKRRQKSVALGIPVKGNKRKAQARLEELKKEYSAGIMEPETPQEESPLFADFLREWLKITAPTIERTTYQSYKGLIDARLDAFFRERGLRLEELAALFEATKEDSISVVIQLAAYYGLRRSEVLGIRWSAIDFEKGTLSINHKVTEGIVDGKVCLYTEDKLKTKSSFRTLPLIPPVRVLLEEQRARQQRYRKLFKKSYCTDYLDYVCTDEMGKLFRPNYITDHFKLLLKQHGLRHIRFHDLRHSCASLLLSQGIPMKQIQEWLGHSTFATTADIYSHLDFNSKLESADAITAAFAEEKPAEEQEEDGFGMSLSM